MHSFPNPPRHVLIGDVAAFVGTTPRAIRHYHQIGLLLERERASDGRRRYGHEEVVRLLWIRRMADAGIALDDIRDAFDGATSGSPDGDDEVAIVPKRLEHSLEEELGEMKRKIASVRRMRALGNRLGLLDEFVSRRLEHATEGSLRPSDLDILLVTERIFGPLGAAIQASRFLALAADPALRAESARVDAVEEALDDSVHPDDPRVAQAAAERHAFKLRLTSAIEDPEQLRNDTALVDEWDELHPREDDGGQTSGLSPAERFRAQTAAEVIKTLPYDFSPARLRAMELTLRLGVETEETA